MITADDIKNFAPKARKEYADALLNGLEHLEAAGILDNELRTSHFLAQCAAETGGFTVIRESLTYTTAKRLREVWPARFRSKSNAELAHLLRNPVALGDAVYRGRMGNTASGDGYNYRGGGFLQTTGKYAVEKYCKTLGITPRSDILDDIPTTLRFACLEWVESGCNQWADENSLIKVSRAINVGSATSNVAPVGMKNREQWFAKAWAIWGVKGKPDLEKTPMAESTKVSIATVGATGGAALLSGPPAAVTETVSQVSAWQSIVSSGQTLAMWGWENIWVVGAVGGTVAGLTYWNKRRTAE